MGRILGAVAAACARAWPLTLAVAGAVTALCVWLGLSIKMNDDRNALVGEDKAFNAAYEEYVRDFDEQEDLMIVIEAPDMKRETRRRVKALAHELAEALRAEKMTGAPVTRQSAADKGGDDALHGGDRVLSAGGRPVKSFADLREAIEASPGSPLTFELLRRVPAYGTPPQLGRMSLPAFLAIVAGGALLFMGIAVRFLRDTSIVKRLGIVGGGVVVSALIALGLYLYLRPTTEVEKTLSVSLVPKAGPGGRGDLGIEPHSTNVIADVTPDSAYERAGLEPGDRLVAVGLKTQHVTVNDVFAWDPKKEDSGLKLRVRRGDGELELTVRVPDVPAKDERMLEPIVGHPPMFPEIIERINPDDMDPYGLLFQPEDTCVDFSDTIEVFSEALTLYGGDLTIASVAKASAERIAQAASPSTGADHLAQITTGLLAEYYHWLKDRKDRSPLDQMFEQESNDPVFDEDGYMFSPDGILCYVRAVPADTETGFGEDRLPVKRCRQIVSALAPRYPGLRVGVTGLPAIYSDEMKTSNDDMMRATLFALTGVALLFVYAYKSVARPVISVICIGVAVLWTFGFVALTLGYLNLLAMVFAVMLVSLGDDFSQHFLTHYQTAYRRSAVEAIRSAYSSSGPGVFFGATTMAAAFFSAKLTGFKGLAELGWITAAGLMITFVVMITVFPAMLAMWDRRRKRPILSARSLETRPLAPFGGLDRVTILALVAVTALGAWYGARTGFDYNMLSLQSPRVESVLWERKLLARDPRALFAVSRRDTPAELADLREKFEERSDLLRVESALPEEEGRKRKILARAHQAIADLEPPTARPQRIGDAVDGLVTLTRTVRKHDTSKEIHDLVLVSVALRAALAAVKDVPKADAAIAFAQERLCRELSKMIGFVKRNSAPPPFDPFKLPVEMSKNFISKSGKMALMVYPKGDIWDWQNLREFVAAVRSVDPASQGTPIQIYTAGNILFKAFLNAAWLSLCAIVILVFIAFRTVRDTLIALTPLVSGMALLLACMAWTGVSFNFANFFAVPILIGIAVNCGIHLVAASRGEDPAHDMRPTLRAMTFSTLTTILGFATLIPANHLGVSSLGFVLTLGMATSLVVTWTLTLSLVKWKLKARAV